MIVSIRSALNRTRLAALAAVLLLAACSGTAATLSPVAPPSPSPSPSPNASPSPEAHTLEGTVETKGRQQTLTTPHYCEGALGYDDIKSGTQLVIKSESDTILGTATLADQTQEPAPRTYAAGEPNEVICTFGFAFKDLPGAKFYTISVGKRPAITFSFDDLVRMNWRVELSVGV